MADDCVPTSGGVPLTDEVLDRLADEAEAGYDIRRLRPHVTQGPRNDALDALVLRAVAAAITVPLLTLGRLHTWCCVPAVTLGTAVPTGPLERWLALVTELFTPDVRYDAVTSTVTPGVEDVVSVLSGAATAECVSARRVLMTVKTFLVTEALNLGNAIDETPTNRPRPLYWAADLHAVTAVGQRFGRAYRPEHLQEVLVDLLFTPAGSDRG